MYSPVTVTFYSTNLYILYFETPRGSQKMKILHTAYTNTRWKAEKFEDIVLIYCTMKRFFCTYQLLYFLRKSLIIISQFERVTHTKRMMINTKYNQSYSYLSTNFGTYRYIQYVVIIRHLLDMHQSTYSQFYNLLYFLMVSYGIWSSLRSLSLNAKTISAIITTVSRLSFWGWALVILVPASHNIESYNSFIRRRTILNIFNFRSVKWLNIITNKWFSIM